MYAAGFVGAGNMARALVRGLIDAGLFLPGSLQVTDVVAGHRQEFRAKYGVGWAADNRELVRTSRTIVLAVKPQMLAEVTREIRPEVTTRKLFVSIAAGIPVRRIAAGLGREARIVRVMPNTPALLGKGMSVVVRGPRATVRDERLVLRMLRAVGDAIPVSRESLLDPVTGLSGSGPAYVYRFAEALIAAGRAQGLSARVSRRLVFQTLEGASVMLRDSGETPERLREMVSSPGGTTLAGLASLEEDDFFATVGRAVDRATARSKELSR